ncbi:MAG: N-acetyl-gamma-glutamyl-phosphate reductase [Deltaproteobacteria bacterium]|nr:N-acetyl-gamma-glutamyl-phosphate reductase [Deltaproteobacteria bacterium]
MAKIRVAVVGASGYTGVELMRILALHPGVELTIVTSRQHTGQPVAGLFPSLREIVGLEFSDNDLDEVAKKADLVFTALPHKAAIEVVAALHAAGKKVVDLSADYRFSDRALYEEWYQPHSRPEVLAKAVYGLPELFRNEIVEAGIVGNPGCYPTSVILPLAPILKLGLVDPGNRIIIDAKSGTSGAGRGLSTGSLYCEVNESFKPYKAGQHRHQPEMVEQLGRVGGRRPDILFVPHLLPVNRGILSSIYVSLNRDAESELVADALQTAYADEPFVRLLPQGELPALSAVRGSNYCDIAYVLTGKRQLILFSAIDNLVKGAAGQAVQNMNLMCGLPETSGLATVALAP